jgi:DNA-binding NtrC family response regulator
MKRRRHQPAVRKRGESTAAGSMLTTVKVLLVEDDPQVLLGTKQALELAGFEVEPFTDAETAAECIVPDVPAIIICDVNLPGMDGLSLLSHATGYGDIATAVDAMRQAPTTSSKSPSRPSG